MRNSIFKVLMKGTNDLQDAGYLLNHNEKTVFCPTGLLPPRPFRHAAHKGEEENSEVDIVVVE